MKRDRRSINQRQAEMLTLIRKRQEIMVDELSELFHVSPMTVRRDLHFLEKRGKISRFHGGASVHAGEMPSSDKDAVPFCRQLIARRAAELVESGATILINGSGTAIALLDYLDGKPVRVFTNNGMVIGHSYPSNVDVRLSGGNVRSCQYILTGDLTMRSLIDIRADVAFLGCGGISPDGEIMCGIPAELGINETMIAHADSYYILADHTKIGKSSLYASFQLEKKGCIITDERADPKVLDRLRAAGMQVIQVSAAEMRGESPEEDMPDAE
ncbi:MAG: DeoR/GlpR transcriptional regulator [Clostridia bacterium]|nr:DeoR/GlpR transcriptional regulator [Clostridia bacterium]